MGRVSNSSVTKIRIPIWWDAKKNDVISDHYFDEYDCPMCTSTYTHV